MKKFLLTLILILLTTTNAFAAKIPDEVKNLIKKDFAQTDFRFDGLITLPDGTVYLPLYPALVKKPEQLEIKLTVPAGKSLTEKPDIIILNNDFTLIKVMLDAKGRKTVIFLKEPPIEVKTGLLPQDMLVPSGLIIPDNIKGIIGNLQIATAQDAGLKVKSGDFLDYKPKKTTQTTKNIVATIPQLANKTIYISTCYSKNIQVVRGEGSVPEYALSQKSIPIDIEATPDDKFLLVTQFGKTFVDVISIIDERVIKQIDLTIQGEEIVVDGLSNKAYVSSSSDSSIYVINLSTMSLVQKIKAKGKCEKLSLTDDGKKLFYADKKTDNVWVIELNNNFVTREIGRFPSISKIKYGQGKIYITSRIKNKLAIIDYATSSLIMELDVESKPIDMLTYKNNLFILSADKNIVQVVDMLNDVVTDVVHLNTGGFSTRIYRIKNTNVAVITDTKVGKYSVMDLDKKIILKTNPLEVPVSQIVVVPNITRKIGK